MFDFSELKEKCQDIEKWLAKEFTSIRTGRATSAILDTVQVEAYGSRMPVREFQHNNRRC